jgi:hypothetical protein
MGSTLEVMGLLFGQYGWAIVGGTGKFSLATGSIKVNNTGEGIDNWNLQITIEVFCPVFSGSGVRRIDKIGILFSISLQL